MARLALWLALANAVQLVLGMARSVVLGRWLGVEAFGELGYILALVTLADIAAQAGLSNIVTREVAAVPGRDGRIFGASLALRTAMVVVMGAVVWALVGPWAALMLLGTVGQLGVSVIRAKLLRGPQIAANLLPGSLAVAGVLACAAVAKPSAGVAIAALALAGAAASAGQLLIAGASLKGKLSAGMRVAAALLRESWPLWLSEILIVTFSRMSVLMLRWLQPGSAGNESIGYFQIAYTLTEGGNFVLGALVMVTFPMMSAMRNAPAGRLKYVLGKAMRFGLLAGGGAMVAQLALGSPVVRILYGSEYSPAVPALMAMAPILPLAVVNGVLATLLVAAGLQVWVLAFNVVFLAFNALANFWAIRAFGFTGAAAVTTATNSIAFALFWWKTGFLRRGGRMT